MHHKDSQEMYMSVVFLTEIDEPLVRAQPACCAWMRTFYITMVTDFK